MLYACGIFESSVPVNWSPALEDMILVTRSGVECTQNTTLQREHQNQTLFVTTSCNIDLSLIDDMSSVSFLKTFDGGNVTFSCAGKHILYKGVDNAFNYEIGRASCRERV